MPSLIDRFTALWRSRTQQTEVVTMTPAPSSVMSAVAAFNTQRGRRSRILDSRAMLDEDPRPEQSIATLARDVAKGGFTLQITGPRAADALTVAEVTSQGLKLAARLDDWLRLT